jgi:hypothetical protein
MKNQIKTLVLAGVSVAAAATTAHAQTLTANYAVGDVLAGFTTQAGNDLILNLGLESALANGQSWDITSLVGQGNIPTTGLSHSLASTQWGVVAGPSGVFGYGTGNPIPLPNLGALNAAKGDINGFGSLISSGFATPSSTALGDGSWNNGTISASTSTFGADWYNPNSTGAGTVNFYQSKDNGSALVLLNTWTLSVNASGDDILTYGSAVPEPTTYGLLAGAGLLALSLRRRVARA